ncbi:hypothetical protein HY025_00270 [Candidatus Daviesbacteria bacterium]|nr:hypothetical protein [Candidatus Daviesbacteria bacterium]
MKEQLRNLSTRIAEKSQNIGREAVNAVTHPGIGTRVFLATLVGSGAGLEMSNSLGQNPSGNKVGIEHFVATGMPSFNTGIVRAQEVPTPSEDPFFPEQKPGNPYNTIAQEGQAPWDEITYQIQLGLIQAGDCLQITEMQSSEAHARAVRDNNPDEEVYRHDIKKVDVSNCSPAQPAALPAATPTLQPQEECGEHELGTDSGNGAKVNEFTVTREYVLHGDGKVNGGFRADNDGKTGLIQRIHATPANPAHVEVADTKWGLDLVCFPNKADMDANIQQGIDHLHSQGMRADVIDWPGPNQAMLELSGQLHN